MRGTRRSSSLPVGGVSGAVLRVVALLTFSLIGGQLSGDKTGYSSSPVFFVDHYRADEGYDRRPVLVETRGLDSDNPDVGTAPRLPLLDHSDRE